MQRGVATEQMYESLLLWRSTHCCGQEKIALPFSPILCLAGGDCFVLCLYHCAYCWIGPAVERWLVRRNQIIDLHYFDACFTYKYMFNWRSSVLGFLCFIFLFPHKHTPTFFDRTASLALSRLTSSVANGAAENCCFDVDQYWLSGVQGGVIRLLCANTDG